MSPPRAALRRRVVAGLLAALGLLGLLTACVRVPTSGPVEQVDGEQPTCQNCVTFQVAGPAPGDGPQQIVEGYLRATSNYQPNYSVAKQFLTAAAAQSWSPEDGVTIYSGTPVARGSRVDLDGRLHGTLGPDRTYTARDSRLQVNFGVVLEDGQWRIGRPPPGLMVVDFKFTSFYRPYDLYFLGTNATLVPEPIHLPDLRSQAGIASVLMKALLAGPSAWLRPAVTSAIPAGTALSVDAVTVADGVATVPLSDSVLQLNDQQRLQLAAQVIYTLKQAAGIQGVAFTVDQQPYPIPGADPQTSVVTVDAVSRDVEPVPYTSGNQLYVVRDRKVGVLTETGGPPDSQPIVGPLGEGAVAVNSLAVSPDTTQLAVVSDRRTRLRVAELADGKVSSVISGVRELLPPHYTRFGELWVMGEAGGRQRLWVIVGGRRREVAAPLVDGRVTAFEVSPDGTRLALVRRVGGRSELGLALITRSDRITVDGWRRLDVTRSETPNLRHIEDLTWVDATDLLVLGGASARANLTLHRVNQDASTVIPEGEATAWQAERVTSLFRTQTVVVVGRDGKAWRDDGTSWATFLDEVTAAAFPG